MKQNIKLMAATAVAMMMSSQAFAEKWICQWHMRPQTSIQNMV